MDMEPGKLYMKDVATGVITEVNITEVNITQENHPLPLKEGVNLSASATIETKIKKETWRKLLGYISQKKFRKLLRSLGYHRNMIETIIRFEWECKRHYTIQDYFYWKFFKE